MSFSPPVVSISSKVRHRQDQTRRLLLQHSAELFIARGFENVSVEDILAATGIARSSFYRFFANREALLTEIVRPVFQRGLTELRAIPNDSPRQMVMGIFQAYLNLWELDADALRVATRVGRVHFSLFQQDHGEFRSELVGLVTRAEPVGILLNGDADYSARLIARVAVPILEVFSTDADHQRLFTTTMEGLLLKPEVES
jgi:AcrR family transcriptional regulator